jgi:hypothetical protein
MERTVYLFDFLFQRIILLLRLKLQLSSAYNLSQKRRVYTTWALTLTPLNLPSVNSFSQRGKLFRMLPLGCFQIVDDL